RRVGGRAEFRARGGGVCHSVCGRELPGRATVAARPASSPTRRGPPSDDRHIDVFEGGFVIRYTLSGVQHSGHRGALWICIVGLCRDGKITRIDEYMDSSKFAAWAGRKQ